MREEKIVTIITLVLIALGISVVILTLFFPSKFNFYKSEISINSNQIEEKLFFQPNKDYHTLFRNFVTPVFVTGYSGEYIKINFVSCSEGTPYVYEENGEFFIFNTSEFLFDRNEAVQYTEKNEYGCSFGSYPGFKKGQEYSIISSYELNPENLFLINGKYYIKFIAYSPYNHNLLVKNLNFIVKDGAVSKKVFLPNEDIIIYLPYEKSDIIQFNILNKPSFEFDNSGYIFLISLILSSFLPAIIFFFVWYIFGRERSFQDLPSALSYYPKERNPWEVTAFFNPPFGEINNNFFSSMLLDFYRRKILDLKTIGKDVYIKIKDYSNLDKIESDLLSFLKKVRNLGKTKEEQGFFNIKKSLGTADKSEVQDKYEDIQKKIKNYSRDYLEFKGRNIILASLIIIFPFVVPFINLSIFWFFFLYFPYLIIVLVLSFRSSLFIRFKKDYYIEYQNWQAFKKYLASFPSMRDSPPQAVVLWEKYLVYSTALGIGEKVIKKLKDWKIIKQQDYTLYSSTFFISSSMHLTGAGYGRGGFGGGFAGAAAGGIGGGGGGGR